MSGPPPKPTALRAIDGNRGKRATNKQEPDPEYLEATSLQSPAWLSERAKAVWDEIAPPLQKARLVAVIDVTLLAMCCEAVAQYRYAVSQVGDHAVLPAAAGKGEQVNPWMIVQSMSFKQAVVILRDFGVSPAARTRIALQPQMDLFGKGGTDGQAEKSSKYFAKQG